MAEVGTKPIWDYNSKEIIHSFCSGVYRFDVQKKVEDSNGEFISLWSSRDAVIIKVITQIMQERLKPVLLKNCYHVKDHGGLKGAVRDVSKTLPNYKFFFKTDVQSYYNSIDHYILMMKLHDYFDDHIIIGYIWQFLNRCVEWGGLYEDIRKGIPRGASLSPLLGAFYLLELDQIMEKLDVKYLRYMDDILILAKTRWKLKKAIKIINQTFNSLKLEKHPDKTLIGKTDRGFIFLGYHLKPGVIEIVDITLDKFFENALRLYEQKPKDKTSKRLGEYVKKWVIWATSGTGWCDARSLILLSILNVVTKLVFVHQLLNYDSA
jgi:hypothetical protein